MKLKVMQETRKSIMEINEITNPKRATFIKEATQHNHLHQDSKKDENKNELSQPKEFIDADQYTEAETITEGTINRVNPWLKSTGAKTPEGKERSKMNALKINIELHYLIKEYEELMRQ